jgi:hypothetical protein
MWNGVGSSVQSWNRATQYADSAVPPRPDYFCRALKVHDLSSGGKEPICGIAVSQRELLGD